MIREFKVYYDGKPASPAQLDDIEEIVVEQEVDRIWEARIKFASYVSEAGVWSGEDDANRRAFKRVRVEARIGNGSFIPLIDGCKVGQYDEHSAAPGSSFATIIVHDDSALLHRTVKSETFAGKSDGDIVRQILQTAALGGMLDIDPLPARQDMNIIVNQSGTDMQMLRSIAFRYGNYHAYVLPGDVPGASIGCFKKFPETVDQSIPPLLMFGESRNLAEFHVTENSLGMSEVEAASLSLGDKTAATIKSSRGAIAFLGDDPAGGVGADKIGTERLPPGFGDLTDIEDATKGKGESLSYIFSAEGSVLPLRYTGILRPYKLVPVQISDSRYSGVYLISRVTHTLGISEYTQSFTMRRNAVSDSTGNNNLAPLARAVKSGPINTQGITF